MQIERMVSFHQVFRCVMSCEYVSIRTTNAVSHVILACYIIDAIKLQLIYYAAFVK